MGYREDNLRRAEKYSDRRQMVLYLYRRGYTQVKIREELGIPVGIVNAIISADMPADELADRVYKVHSDCGKFGRKIQEPFRFSDTFAIAYFRAWSNG